MTGKFCNFVYNKNDKEVYMKFKLTHLKSEAFNLDSSSKVYERLRAFVVYDDGSVIDNLFFWFDYTAMEEFVLGLARDTEIDFTVCFVELRHTSTPHCTTGNLLMVSECRHYEE